jgi:hypothetical protein
VCSSNFHQKEECLRRGRKAAARTVLSAACVVAFALGVLSSDVAAAPSLREKDVRRAEKVLAKLRLLDEAGVAQNDPRAFRELTGKLYPELFVAVADMRESDLKTDLDTAVFLYDEVGRTWFNADASKADCRRERSDIYLPLCLELRGGTKRQLLLAKAGLHARWAEASVNDYGGERGPETSQSLAAMKAARENDSVIAMQVLETLKTLEGLVNTLPKNADSEERPAVSGADRRDVQFGDALAGAGELIASMPRSPTFYYLSNAWGCYRDGLFWERKVSRSRSLVVAANGFNRDPLKELGLDAEQVGYSVVARWKSAVKYTRLAEQSLPGLESYPQSLSRANADTSR